MQENDEEGRRRGGGGGKVFDLFQRFINSLSALVTIVINHRTDSVQKKSLAKIVVC